MQHRAVVLAQVVVPADAVPRGPVPVGKDLDVPAGIQFPHALGHRRGREEKRGRCHEDMLHRALLWAAHPTRSRLGAQEKKGPPSWGTLGTWTWRSAPLGAPAFANGVLGVV